MDDRMKPWAEKRLVNAELDLKQAKFYRNKCQRQRDEILAGNPSLDTADDFWNWATMQPKRDR